MGQMTAQDWGQVCEQLADDERRASIDAVMMWLRHSGVVGQAERQRMATTIMLGSVAAQAGLLGLLRCCYCWDSGCRVCTPQLRRRPGGRRVR